MRIELTWPRTGAADRTLTIPVPGIPRPSASSSTLLRGALRFAEPVASSAAAAAGAGVLARLALPFALRLVQQSLDGAAPAVTGADAET